MEENNELDRNSQIKLFGQTLKAAESGDSKAFVPLGDMYLEGKTDEGLYNFARAEYWYEKALLAGYNVSQEFIEKILTELIDIMSIRDAYTSGYDYYKMKKWQKAIICFEYCLSKGGKDVKVYYLLGETCFHFSRNQLLAFNKQMYLQKSIDYLTIAAERNDKGCESYIYNSENFLGVIYGRYISPVDYKKAIYWYERAVAHGIEEAMFNLGVMYDKGYGVKQDYDKARELYLQAAELGVLDAQVNYAARTYRSNDDIIRRRSFSYLSKNAKAGSNIAQNFLGLMYYHNNVPGEKPDPERKKCIHWLLISAKNGNKDAIENLAMVRRELKESSWTGIFKKAVLSGFAEGVGDSVGDETSDALQEWIDGDLGELLADAIGDEVGDEVSNIIQSEGEELIFGDHGSTSKQVKQLSPEELFNIGEDYYFGNKERGINQDTDQAMSWYKKAADLGNKEAQKKLKDIEDNNKEIQAIIERFVQSTLSPVKSEPKVEIKSFDVTCDGKKMLTITIDYEAYRGCNDKFFNCDLTVWGGKKTFKQKHTITFSNFDKVTGTLVANFDGTEYLNLEHNKTIRCDVVFAVYKNQKILLSLTPLLYKKIRLGIWYYRNLFSSNKMKVDIIPNYS